MGTLGKLPEAKPILTGQDILSTRDIVNKIYIDDKIVDYILNIIFSTRNPAAFNVKIDGLLLYGASPRASLALKLAGKAHAFLSGRAFVTPHDIKQICHDILRHRLRRTYEAEAENVSPDNIIDTILSTIPVP
jgi:MoxR-like ATPase